MNKLLLSLTSIAFITSLHSQTNETITMGNGYANHVWYSLESGVVGTSPKNNWDLAFEVNSYGVGVHTNRSIEMSAWRYPVQGIEDWATLDTTGMAATWSQVFNSDESWELGAFNQLPEGMYNYGWGTYNIVNHSVQGDRIYVLKLADNTYRKFLIESRVSGVYTFKLAMLDHSNEITRQFTNSGGLSDQALLGYYSIQDDSFVNREPNRDAWDLAFLQYNAEQFGTATNQRVTGVLQNNNVEAAKIMLASPESTYSWSAQTFQTAINTIGFDWKVLNYQTFQWEIPDTLVYVIKSQQGNYYEIRFATFTGTGTGVTTFNKLLLSSASLDTQNTPLFSQVYPNPATESIQVVFDTQEDVVISLYNTTGGLLEKKEIKNPSGITQEQFNLTHLTSGLYLITIESVQGNKTTHKIMKY
jgi:hypothetical protein